MRPAASCLALAVPLICAACDDGLLRSPRDAAVDRSVQVERGAESGPPLDVASGDRATQDGQVPAHDLAQYKDKPPLAKDVLVYKDKPPLAKDMLVYKDTPPLPKDQGPVTSISGLHVSGNAIVNGNNQKIILRGVNRSGTEYACIQGWGIFDGPSDAASLQAIKSWKANAVRVPLNETCWLGINGAPAAYSGATYQAAIASYVSLIVANGLVPILDLHWAAPGTQKATAQLPMANADHTPEFWKQVANAFKANSSVIFELYNEPYPDNQQNTAEAWRCWKDGGTCTGVSYQAAGMQSLVNAVRGTGATNVILLSGLSYSNNLTGWLANKPTDPTGNLGAVWHIYNFNVCSTTTCWTSEVLPVIQQVPLVATEIGEDSCAGTFLNNVMSFLDTNSASYLAWTWDTWGSCSDLALITSYNGTPTPSYGVIYKNHLAAVQP